MVDLTNVDLLALIGAETPLKRAASTNGGEFAGPCPGCGGRDRFRVWPTPTQGGNPRYWCRRCDAKGDAIDYLRWREPGLSFRAACARLNVDPGPKYVGGSTAVVAHTTRRGARDDNVSAAQVCAAPTPRPRPIIDNRPALRSDAWQQSALRIVTKCREDLWGEEKMWEEGSAAVCAYLHQRGFTDATIRAADLGYNVTSCYTPRAAWGLAPDGDKMVWLPPGVLIPWWIGGQIWRLNVRWLEVFEGEAHSYNGGGSKYIQAPGSAPGLYNVDAVYAGARVVLVEGEFCALSLMQAAGDLVVPVATGSVSGARAPRWMAKLALASEVILAFDADEAGEKAAAWWAGLLDRNTRRLVPTRHDVNDMLAAGDDLRGWLGPGAG